MQEHHNDFFNRHSVNYIEMALSTDRMERITDPDGYGKRTGDCKDTAEFFLICPRNKLELISFQVQGCMNTIACCNTVAVLAEGRTIDEAWTISPEQVNDFLQTLPEDHFHCAQLAVGAFYLALADVVRKQKAERTDDAKGCTTATVSPPTQ